MTEPTHYLCGCGHEFEEGLGAFGCPNCEGDEGPAVPQRPPAKSNVRWVNLAELAEIYPPKGENP